MKTKQKLFYHVYMYGAFLFFIVTLFFIAINFIQNYTHFKHTSQKMHQEYFHNQHYMLEWKVEHFVQLIQSQQKEALSQANKNLQEEVSRAYALAQILHQTHYQTLPEETLKKMVAQSLHTVRRLEGGGCFFIINGDTKEIIFSEGTKENETQVEEARNRESLEQLVSLAKTEGEGFYLHQNNNTSPKPLAHRSTYVKYFAPYGWVIGAGMLLDDHVAALQEKVLADINAINFDATENNYLFIGRWDGVALTDPAKGRNMFDVQDINGKYIVRELIQSAKNGGGFVEYVMPDLEGKRTLNKLSYAQGVPQWEWYVGSGVYTDDINAQIALEFENLKKTFKASLIGSLVAFIFVTALMALFYRRFNHRLEKDFEAFFSFFDSLAHYNYPINKDRLRFLEFETLATSANAMLAEKLDLEHKLAHLAHHDTLTSLPNRTLLHDRIERGIATCKREKCMLALCFIDLDNFKKINDSFGHSYGDEALLQVVQRIGSVLRETDTLARLGGDEFVLVIKKVHAKEQIDSVLQKVQKVFEAPFIIHHQTFFLTASIGVSFYPNDGTNPEVLLKNADLAMYKAKSLGKNNFYFYEASLSSASLKVLAIENELKSAILNEEFEVFYQPQINLQTGKCIGIEALLRWNHPQRGLLGPAYFIPYAEESRMILPIGAFVLSKACRDFVTLQETIGLEGKVSVNISGVQLEHEDFLNTLKHVLNQTNITPSSLELEITESFFMKDAIKWNSLLGEIRALGVHVAIDDFGTGYSSLSYLRRLPVDKLKIDISFVRDLPEDKDAKAIAKAIIVLAKSMRMRTLAEGIEKPEQAAFLANEGCDEAQGYFYEKPIPFEKIKDWIEERNKN